MHGAEPYRDLPRTRMIRLTWFATAVIVLGLATFALSIGAFAEEVTHGTASLIVTAILAVAVHAPPFSPPGRKRFAFFLPSICFTFGILIGWGLVDAIVTQAACVVVSSVRLRHGPMRALFDIGRFALAFAAAEFMLHLVDVPHLQESIAVDPLQAVAIVGAGVAWFIVAELIASTAVWLRDAGRWTVALRGVLTDELQATVPILLLSPLVVAVADESAAFVPILLIPLYSFNRMAQYAAAERRASRQDDLTGLPNRKAVFIDLNNRQGEFVERAAEMGLDQRRMALVVLDLDRFRQVNEALGHAAGDQLLTAVAERMTQRLGDDTMVARLGGDEFAVFAPDLPDAAAVQGLGQRVAAAFGDPIRLDGLQLDVGAGIGIAVYPDHGQDGPTLLRHAEIAMYDSKDRAASYAIYTPETDQSAADRLALLGDLRQALELGRPGEIELHYQPQVDLATSEVVGVEALVRWHHPHKGAISPELMIRTAEHTAVMRLVTNKVIDVVVGQLAAWRSQGLHPRASINVSVRDLQRPEFVDYLARAMVANGVPSNQIQLEITEGALMSDPRRVLVCLHRLDKLGVALSLDDFGTGYSSLQHLRRLPLAEVKIDRSFVLGMATDSDDTAVVRSIIDLARALGLRVVAEGVETDGTRRMLADRGCDVGQGWYFARPMPAEQFVSWLSRHSGEHDPAYGSTSPDK